MRRYVFVIRQSDVNLHMAMPNINAVEMASSSVIMSESALELREDVKPAHDGAPSWIEIW
jgi:hypothetical protein